MHEKSVSKIELELALIDELFMNYNELLARVQEKPPDLIELTALASVLHSFYNGVEHIFELIAKDIDEQLPAGDRWHRELLTQMGRMTSQRGKVLGKEQVEILADYLGFRHFYRHSYSHFLDWEELELLVTPLPLVWNQLKQEIVSFVDGLIDDQQST